MALKQLMCYHKCKQHLLLSGCVFTGVAAVPSETLGGRWNSVFMYFHFNRYNKAHASTRISIERAFGVWKRRFPCLDMKLQHKPHRSVRIITACAALHNLACIRKDPEPPQPIAPTRPSNGKCRSRQHSHLPPFHSTEDLLRGTQARELLVRRRFS